MRVGIFGDVHANHEALDAVIEAFGKESVEASYTLGDLVGYGGSPAQCIRHVREFASAAVLGNDDAALAGLADYSFYYENARAALDTHLQMLSSADIAWLRSLGYVLDLEDLDIRLSHSSPLNPDRFEYLFLQEHALRCLRDFDTLPQITFVGHTHLFKVFELTATAVRELPAINFAARDDRKYIVGAGSVGQPRDRFNRAGFVVFDSGERRIEFKRTEYDIERAAIRIVEAGLAQEFAHRLFIGV